MRSMTDEGAGGGERTVGPTRMDTTFSPEGRRV